MNRSNIKLDSNKFDVVLTKIDEDIVPNESFENFPNEDLEADYQEQVKLIQESVNVIDSALLEITANEVYPVVETMEQFRASNWNNLKAKERKTLFATFNAYISAILTEELLFPEIYTSNENINGKWLSIEDGKVYVNKEVFENKNNGLEILRGYFLELRIDLVYGLIGSLYQIGTNRDDLEGLTKIYYDNICQSNLYNNWNNFYDMNHKDYIYQPVIVDAVKLSNELMFKFIKRVYKKYNVIDKELSALIYNLMEFRGRIPFYKEQRNRVIKEQINNVKKVKKEFDSYKRYLEVTIGDLSKLNDDEFFALFNTSYYYGLNIDEDGFMITRLSNLSNELIKRVFKDFDIENIELPKFDFEMDKDMCVTMKVIYDNEVTSANVTDSSMVFRNVMQLMSLVAQKNKLFKFKDEQEELDYDDMRRWHNFKKEYDKEDPVYKDIINDGLNIISRKVTEMWRSLELRIEEAISKFDWLSKGKSMIVYDNKDSYYDYHEFKNGDTQEEVCKKMMTKIRAQLKEIDSRGGR